MRTPTPAAPIAGRSGKSPDAKGGKSRLLSQKGDRVVRFDARAQFLQLAALLGCICIGSTPAAQANDAKKDNPAEALELPTVEIIGTTPLPGLGTPTRDVPANVQVYTSRDLAGQGQTNV